MKKIVLKIDAGKKMCTGCEYLAIFQTGLLHEFHPQCRIFYVFGDWGKKNMQRAEECLIAEIKNVDRHKS